MSGDTKQPLLPRLRFPEFRDEEEWNAKNLKNVCEVNPSNAGLPEKFVYIDLESVEAGKLKLRKIIYQEEAPSRAQRLLRYGDVIFQIVRPYQRNNFHFKINEEIPYVASTGYAQLRANESEDFLFQAVHTDGFVEQVIAKCTGSSYPAINSSDLADLPVAIPKKAEQQKIADCLSSLDELITAETQKLDTLKTHKKGLLQQLFPREDETVPRLRFPEFRKADGWKKLTVAEVSEINPPKEKKQDNESVSFISMASVSEDGWLNNLEIRTYGEVKKGYTAFAEHDVIVAKITPCFENGKAALVRKLKNGIGFGSTEFHVFRAGQRCLPEFLFLQLYRDSVRVAGARSMTGNAGQRRVPVSFFERLPFYLPSINEQQCIIFCFASLDDLITAQNKKIDALKAHKKGLMQQLFPVLDEVSA